MSPRLQKGAASALVCGGAWQSGLQCAAQTATHHGQGCVRVHSKALEPVPPHKEYVRRTYTARPSMSRGS
eukprot:223975-Alexandrium_andersonii.AAC.1